MIAAQCCTTQCGCTHGAGSKAPVCRTKPTSFRLVQPTISPSTGAQPETLSMMLCLQSLRDPLLEVGEVFAACQKTGIIASMLNGSELPECFDSRCVAHMPSAEGPFCRCTRAHCTHALPSHFACWGPSCADPARPAWALSMISTQHCPHPMVTSPPPSPPPPPATAAGGIG